MKEVYKLCRDGKVLDVTHYEQTFDKEAMALQMEYNKKLLAYKKNVSVDRAAVIEKRSGYGRYVFIGLIGLGYIYKNYGQHIKKYFKDDSDL